MAWWCKELWHQQPRYWPCSPGLSTRRSVLQYQKYPAGPQDMNFRHQTSQGSFLWTRPVNERRLYNVTSAYIVTSSFIGWAHSQNDPCIVLGLQQAQWWIFNLFMYEDFGTESSHTGHGLESISHRTLWWNHASLPEKPAFGTKKFTIYVLQLISCFHISMVSLVSCPACSVVNQISCVIQEMISQDIKSWESCYHLPREAWLLIQYKNVILPI